MTKNYDSKSIEVYAGLDGVRKHPAMYLGALGAQGAFQCLKEIADNSKDEIKETTGDKRIVVIVDRDTGYVTVSDTGRGIPVDIHPKTKLPGVETVLTMLHAGAKSGAKTAYGKGSIGVHGVGASVVNALCSEFVVWTKRGRDWWSMSFSKGKTTRKLHKEKPPLRDQKCGTVVRYRLDESIIPDAVPIDAVLGWCDLNRYFAPIHIQLNLIEKKRTKTVEYAPRPTHALLKKHLTKLDAEATSPIFEIQTPTVRVIAAWTGLTESHVFASVSGSPTTGGTHVRGLEQAIKQAFTKKIGNADPMVGLCIVLDVTVDQPSFEGQAKTRLASRHALGMVRDAVAPALTKWLRQHKDAAKEIIEHATAITKLNSDMANRKKLAKDARQSHGGRLSLPKGFVSANAFPPDRRETYIVEGASAGGSAKVARMPYQEVLPLRGKLPNVTKASGKLLTNEEIRKIVCVTGYDPRNPNKRLRTGKIVVMADADHDGQHIEVLLLGILCNVMPEVFEQGRVYLVKGPLYEAMHNGRQVYGDSIADLHKRYGKVSHVHRMKGWGAAGPPLLRETAFDPSTRRLVRVASLKKGEKQQFDKLMGSNSADRKALLGLAEE